MGDAVWDGKAPHRTGLPAAEDVPPVAVDPPGAPQTTRVIRVSDERDGELRNRGYSYHSQGWRQGNSVFIFAGAADGQPRLFEVGLANGEFSDSVSRVPWILPFGGETEGWYFDSEGWIYIPDGPRLLRTNPFTGEIRIAASIEGSYPDCRLWQVHSSTDGRTHSATIQRVVSDGAYPKIGSAILRDGSIFRFEPPKLGEIDESAISGDGRFWLIKETQDDDNRIIDLETRVEYIIHKSEGALGHSDMGPDYAIGDDRTVGGASRVNLANPDDRRVLVRFPDWSMGHVSIKAGRCLLTHGELITLLDPETGAVTVFAPHEMILGPGDPYDYQANANLSPDASVAVFASNKAGRMDVYCLVLG